MSQQSANIGKQQQTDFGLYLRRLRERRNLKLSHIAEELHINLWDIERGDRPTSVALLKRLADKYEVPLEEILAMKYTPQLPLLAAIVSPTKVTEDLIKDFSHEEVQEFREEITRYTAFLLLKRAMANWQQNSA